MQSIDNHKLIQGVKNGDESVFNKVFTIYHNSLYGMAYRYLRNHQLADDAVQVIFVKLWTERKNLDPEKSLYGFLFTLLKNHILNMLRSDTRRIERNYEYYYISKAESDNPENLLIDKHYNDVLIKGIESLPPLKKEIFHLRNTGTSYKDIAQKTGCSINTVKSYLNQTRNYLRDFISDHLGEHDTDTG
jgi:RNA polymerase sigma-70 factor (family 1)